MDLRWWPVAVAGLICLAICVALAFVVPMPQLRRRMRPLAHVDRLTRLPEYARVARLQFWSMLALVVLLVIMFLEVLLASSRPVGLTSRGVDAANPEDIMLCVGESVTDPATASLLNYFARQTADFDSQRIGLTSTSLRVVPLTRDYQHATDQFNRYAKLTELQRNVDDDRAMPPGQLTELRAGIDEFSRPLNYVDWARSVEDVLALCLAGFPSGDDTAAHRRSVIYLGPSDIRDRNESRPSLFSAQQVTDMANTAGVQVNVITGSRSANGLDSIASATGGRFETYHAGGTDPTVAAALDRIRANPPAPDVAGMSTSALRGDYPNVPLIAGIVVSALLCVALAVMRR